MYSFLQITPAHDPNDFEVGKRHNLEFINIFTDDGLINSNGGKPYTGMKRFDVRVAVVKDLEAKVLIKIFYQLLNPILVIKKIFACVSFFLNFSFACLDVTVVILSIL